MTHRTALLGAASLAGVVIAGVVTAGASIGLLQSSDSGAIGQLTADTVAPTRVVDVYTDAGGGGRPQEFLVDAAGSVSVAGDGGILRLAEVRPNPGWQWQLTQSSPTDLRVDFSDGSRLYEFVAAMGPSGDVAARVDQAVLKPVPDVASAPSERGDDEGAGGDEHEGRDDDD